MEKKSNLAIGRPSKRQAEVLKFTEDFRKKRGYAPSLAEIASHLGISVPTAHQHVSYLRGKNLLASEKGKGRSIRSLNIRKPGIVEIPLMGYIAAGGPIEAIRDPRPIDVPGSMLSSGAKHYALKVVGTSMIEEGISDGDIVVMREQDTVEDGEKAVAYLPDRDAVTLKKIYRDKNGTRLVPANRTMQPFVEKNVLIQGKVVGVLRKEV